MHVHLKPEVKCLIFLASGCRGQAGGRQSEMPTSVRSGNRIILGNVLVFHLAHINSSWKSQVLLLNID